MLGSGYPNSLNHLALLALPLLPLTYPTNASRTSTHCQTLQRQRQTNSKAFCPHRVCVPLAEETTNMIKYSAECEEKRGGSKKLWGEAGKRGGLGRSC